MIGSYHRVSLAVVVYLTSACGGRSIDSSASIQAPEANATSSSRNVASPYLDVAWRVSGAAPMVIGTHLLATVGDHLAELDPITGAELRRIAGPDGARPFETLMVDASTEARWIGKTRDGWLVAIDPTTLAVRWRTRCDASGAGPCSPVGVRRVGDTIVIAGMMDPTSFTASSAVRTLDAATGRARWSRPLPAWDGERMQVAVTRDLLFLLGDTRLMAFELASGAPRFERALPTYPTAVHGRQIIAQDDLLVFAAGGVVHLARARTGEDFATVPHEGFVGDLLLDHDRLFVLPMWGHGESLAISTRDGQVAWRNASESIFPVPPAVRDGALLFVLRVADDGPRPIPGGHLLDGRTLALNEYATELAVLDLTTGATISRWNLGVSQALRGLAGSNGPRIVAESAGGELVAFHRRATPADVVAFEVSGEVRAMDVEPASLGGLTVQVGDQRVRTTDDGMFVANVQALGAVEVRLIDMPSLRVPVEPPLVSAPVFPHADRFLTHYHATLTIAKVSPWPRD